MTIVSVMNRQKITIGRVTQIDRYFSLTGCLKLMNTFRTQLKNSLRIIRSAPKIPVKIITDREKVDKHEFFKSSNSTYSLRGHKYKIAVLGNRTVARSAFFSQRVVSSWNKLPEKVVLAISVNMFKNRLDLCDEWGN